MNRYAVIGLALLAAPVLAQQPSREVYRCPGNPPLYTDTLTAKEAKEKGCRTLEGAPVTVVQGVRPRQGTPVPKAEGARTAEEKINTNEQRARDSDARRILQDELKREEDKLAALQKEYNNGEPERRGDERNYQKYIDRVADMKAEIARKESDIAALRRELDKLNQTAQPR
jgi:predicted RNase H-like nuclease (RuvC/YqgF family)